MAIKDFKGFKKDEDTYKCRDDRVDNLGTASTKNSTAVVTESSDLVESGAVKDIVGWGNKNLFDGEATTTTDQYGVTWTVDPNDNNVVTVSGTPTGFKAFMIKSKPLSAGVYKLYGISNVINVGFNTINLFNDNTLVRSISGNVLSEGGTFEILDSDVSAGYNRLEITYKRLVNDTPCSGTIRSMVTNTDITDATYEPYHASVDETKANNSVIGTVEGENALKPWSVGEHFIKDGAFKEVTQPIASGGAINDSNTVNKPIADCLVKQATFSDITSASGNIILSDASINVISARISGCIVNQYDRGANNPMGLHVTDMSGNIVANQNLSGTYYYI